MQSTSWETVGWRKHKLELRLLGEISITSDMGEGSGNPLQYSCLEKSHGWRSLVGCSPWGHKESDTTEQLNWTELMRPHAMIFIFWMLSFKSTFSLSTFTFIKRLFSSSSLSAIRVVSSAYLRLLIFLPAILIPAYASSSPVFFSWCTLHIS